MGLNDEKAQSWIRSHKPKDIVSLIGIGLLGIDEVREAFGLSVVSIVVTPEPPFGEPIFAEDDDDEKELQRLLKNATEEERAELLEIYRRAADGISDEELDLIRMDSESPRGED